MAGNTDPSPADFLVRKDDLARTDVVTRGPKALHLDDGQSLVRIDYFALTANNISYAVTGDMLGYWKFFVAPDGWGRIPAWGFGEVVESRCDAVAVGERLYGYFPMSTHLVVTPGNFEQSAFDDVAEHRAALPRIYNSYSRVTLTPGLDEAPELQALFRPLFATSFLLDDFLAREEFFDARSVIVTSASSKTAWGLAFLLAKRHGIDVIGLTSATNIPFTEGLGCYDRVCAYEDVASVPATGKVAIVDIAGSASVAAALHDHFGEKIVHHASVGATHWQNARREQQLSGPSPRFFFAPQHASKRIGDWGYHGFHERVTSAWRAFAPLVEDRVVIERARGKTAVDRVYQDVLAGRAAPDRGHILSLRD